MFDAMSDALFQFEIGKAVVGLVLVLMVNKLVWAREWPAGCGPNDKMLIGIAICIGERVIVTDAQFHIPVAGDHLLF